MNVRTRPGVLPAAPKALMGDEIEQYIAGFLQNYSPTDRSGVIPNQNLLSFDNFYNHDLTGLRYSPTKGGHNQHFTTTKAGG